MRAARDRLIFALDVPTKDAAIEWIERLGDAVSFYKIGMELLTSGEYFQVLEELAARGKKVFVDLKFFDVLVDDRDERAGVKFNDADLLGIPLRITIGPRGLAAGKVELKLRGSAQAEEIALDRAAAEVVARIRSAQAELAA